MDGRVGSVARRLVFELVLAVERFARFAAKSGAATIIADNRPNSETHEKRD